MLSLSTVRKNLLDLSLRRGTRVMLQTYWSCWHFIVDTSSLKVSNIKQLCPQCCSRLWSFKPLGYLPQWEQRVGLNLWLPLTSDLRPFCLFMRTVLFLAKQPALKKLLRKSGAGAARRGCWLDKLTCASNKQPITDRVSQWAVHCSVVFTSGQGELRDNNMSAPIVRATVKAVSRRKILSTRAALTLVSVSLVHITESDSRCPRTEQRVNINMSPSKVVTS